MTRRSLLLLSFVFMFFSNAFSQTSLWTDIPVATIQSYIDIRRSSLPTDFRVVKLNRQLLSQMQARTPAESGTQINIAAAPLFAIPTPEGTVRDASLIESTILSSSLQQQFPGIKTYRLADPANRNQLGRVTVTGVGISGLLFTPNGSIYLAPLGNDFPDLHIVYYIKNLKPTEKVACLARDEVANLQPAAPQAGDCQLRTYRLAVAATGEYTAWAGSQANAIAYITSTINDVTAIFERELAIRFTLITNNNIVYPNAGSDPYNPNDLSTTTLNQNHTALNAQIGAGNYDVGIVFNDGWNGGLAYLNSTCNASFKGGAQAGITFGSGANPAAGPQGPIFVTTVAHEIAHKFGATHTHSATNGQCGGANVNPATAWEVGGGSTIMAYAGVCEDALENWYQPQADHYFHSGSIAQIQNFVTVGAGSACVSPTALLNNRPDVTVAATGYIIPISTPFTLTASGTDVDGNTLLYTWEQLNAGTSATRPLSTSTTGPNFRSFPPTPDPSRTFPQPDSLLAGVSSVFEVLPSVSKTMNFRVTVRDFAAGGGCTDEADVTVSTNASAGPFVVTSQSTVTNLTANGSNTFTVTWNVANTNAAPVNTAAVDILLSVDGGYTYPYTLAAATPNDGSQVLTVPNIRTINGRIKVQAVGNIFFNVNADTIRIVSACAAEGSTIAPEADVAAAAGSATLDLNLAPEYGTTPVTPSGTLTSGDPAGFLAVNYLTPGTCASASNIFRHQLYTLSPSVTGSYTFTFTGGTNGNTVMNLYLGDGAFSPTDPCRNFLVSNATFDGSFVNFSSSFTIQLNAGEIYTLAIGTFNDVTPPLPSAYSVTITPPGGGAVYNNYPNPGAGFNYTYVIVNNATGIITAIDAAANLSNPANFPGGTSYTVYGLSYSNAIPIGTLNSYIGQSFSTLTNDLLFNSARCGHLSRNSVQVTVLAATPVTFLGLKAYKSSGNKVQLAWKTASEQNNDYFEVQRSADGLNFGSVLGRVPGKGNSNEVVEYNFFDHSPLQKWNFYRLRQVDRDGRESLSNVASIQFNRPGALIQLYPNPAQRQIIFEYSSGAAQKVRVSIIDNKGSEVKQVSLYATAGLNRVPLDITSLSNGVYLLKTVIDGNIITGKFVKQ